MINAKEIDTFVHRCFSMYGLFFKDFFNDLVDEVEGGDGIPMGGHLEELPLVVGDNLDMELLAQAAKTLGVRTEAFLNQDKTAVRCWYEKYPYFELRGKFETARQHSVRFSSSPKKRAIDATFDKNYGPENHKRYQEGIENRLIELLKSYDAVMPGCYHENAKITKLTVETNNFTHFDQIAELVESYLSMVSRARELFYRLWDADLSECEEREYNFLVSVLGMRDVGYDPSKPIYYETARKFAPIYREEGYTDYLSYIRYKDADFPTFYTCKELYDYPKLVEKLVQEFPAMKSEFRRMALLAKNFLCSFAWSDEPEPPIEASFDEYLVSALRSVGDDVPSWYHRVYVPKTDDELHGDEKYISICDRLSAPASQGGLKLSLPECKQKSDNYQQRLMTRLIGESRHG